MSWRGRLVCALDGTLMSVPDSAVNLTALVKERCNHGAGGYPTMRVLALVAWGTRSIIDAVFGPASTGELGYGARLAGSLRPGMLLLADRNFAGTDLLVRLAGTGADLLVRCKNARRLPVRARYRDGSYLSALGDLAVRVIARRSPSSPAPAERRWIYASSPAASSSATSWSRSAAGAQCTRLPRVPLLTTRTRSMFSATACM